MPASTLVAEHPAVSRNRPAPAMPPASPPRRRSPVPVLAMFAGLAAMIVAAAVLPGAVGATGRPGSTAPVAASADPLAITLSARDVAVVSQVYEPGQQSGWHAHTGIHAVAVLSGTLTVYDSQCRAETFGPGRPYVGGQEPHFVRNETGEPVVMSVTYLTPTSHAESTRRAAPPAGCPAG